MEADEGRGAVLWWAEEQSQQNAVARSERLLMSPSCRGGPHAARGGPGGGPERSVQRWVVQEDAQLVLVCRL